MKRKILEAWNAALEGISHAANEITIDGEWLKIAPLGDLPAVEVYRDGRALGRRKQMLTAGDARVMAEAFNSLHARLGRLFRGAPIYAGHPDVPNAAEAAQHKDKRRYGCVRELAARADGLYGLVAWNALGREAMEEGHYVFNSPRWALEELDGAVHPRELISIGLTNTPNIPGEPWSKNEPDETDPEPQPEPKPNMNEILKALITAGLLADDADEAAALAAINKLIADAAAKTTEADAAKAEAESANSKVADLENRLQTACNERDQEHQERIRRELDLAITTGRITTAERESWNEKLTADFPGALTAINTIKPRVPTGSQVADLGARKAEAGAASERMTAINSAVRQYAKEHQLNPHTSEGWNTAFAAVRRAQPTLFQN